MAQHGILFPLVRIGEAIWIDACLEENHTLTNTVTDHPVEEGTNISDHSRPDPDQVTLRCFVSNTPLSEQQQKLALSEDGSITQSSVDIGQINDRGFDTFDKLKKLRDEGTLISVVTTLKTYGVSSTEGMMITSLTVPRTRQAFEGLEFTLTIKQIRIVKNQQSTAPKEKNTAQKTHKGAQDNREEYGPAERKKTALKKSTGAVFGK